MELSEFIDKSKKIHGDRYDYSKVEYINNKTKVCIICHNVDKYGIEHGEFWQRPNDHLSKYSCPKCSNEYVPTTEEWIYRANIVHNNKYDYSKTEYINSHKKICIICPIHGEFYQIPNNHLNGNGCPHCNSNSKSKNEENISKMLFEKDINFVRQKTFDWLKYKNHLYLDFYLPQYNIAIEFQGEQHYRPINKFGGNYEFEKIKKRDEIKLRLCNEHNIKIFYLNKKKCNLNEVISYINETTDKKQESK